jgi:hypothetical protein
MGRLVAQEKKAFSGPARFSVLSNPQFVSDISWLESQADRKTED